MSYMIRRGAKEKTEGIVQFFERNKEDLKKYVPEYYPFVKRIVVDEVYSHWRVNPYWSLSPIDADSAYRSVQVIRQILQKRKRIMNTSEYSQLVQITSRLSKLKKYIPEYTGYLSSVKEAIKKPEAFTNITMLRKVLKAVKTLEEIGKKRKTALTQPPAPPTVAPIVSLAKPGGRTKMFLPTRHSFKSMRVIPIQTKVQTGNGKVMTSREFFVVERGGNVSVISDMNKIKGFGLRIGAKKGFGFNVGKKWIGRW